MIDPVFKLALGAVWTAGYRPTREEKSELQRACGYLNHQKMNAHLAEYTGNGFDGMRDYFQREAIRSLKACGYPIAEKPQELDLVCQKAGTEPIHLLPQPGDIIRATKPWYGYSEFGLQGVLFDQAHGFTIANRRGGWHVGTDPERMNCASMGNGGPSSCGKLAASVLTATDETARLFCWAFAFTPEAHTGVEFFLPVRVWDWSGDWVEAPEEVEA